MNKINDFLQNLKLKLIPKITLIDSKFQTLIPNPNLRKVLYIGVGSLFGFMFLIIILGLLLSPMRNNQNSSSLILNKPKIETSTPTTKEELNEMQKEILKLEMEVKDLRFPESKLNIPMIESNIKI